LAARKAAEWARLIYPEDLVELPVLCETCSKFQVVVSIAHASIDKRGGEALALFSGRQEEINAALEYLRDLGITVEEAAEPDNWRLR